MNDYIIKFGALSMDERSFVKETFANFCSEGVEIIEGYTSGFMAQNIIIKEEIDEAYEEEGKEFKDIMIYFQSPLKFELEKELYFPLFGNKGGFCDYIYQNIKTENGQYSTDFTVYDKSSRTQFDMLIREGRPFDYDEEKDCEGESYVEEFFAEFHSN
jgi:hypothetical protein